MKFSQSENCEILSNILLRDLDFSIRYRDEMIFPTKIKSAGIDEGNVWISILSEVPMEQSVLGSDLRPSSRRGQGPRIQST